MNTMQLAFAKAYFIKIGKETKKSAITIGKAFKSIINFTEE